jgi:hypothetical protein
MKKILVLSHNSFSKKQNNGKTLESFFQNFDSENIAQIYLQPEIPDFEYCQQYYRITDYEALNNFIFNGKVGHQPSYTEDNSAFINNTNRFIRWVYHGKRVSNERYGLNKLLHTGFVNRVPFLVSLREILWFFTKWKTKELDDWIKKFSPDVLFFQGSSTIFCYKIALWISHKYNIPLVLQLTDDYTCRIYKYSLLEYVNKFFYIKILKKAIDKASTVIAVSDFMAIEYLERFGGNYKTLMNSGSFINKTQEPLNNEIMNFIYTGNVLLKRWEVLEVIGEALQEINSTTKFKCILNIHSPTAIPSYIINRLKNIDTIKCGNSLNQSELSNAIKNANVVVHVESFDRMMRLITRLSISTKIPEYLGSNRCLFAVGPDDVASIKYLLENQYAHVATSVEKELIKKKLLEVISNTNLREKYIKKSMQGYCKNHSHVKSNMEFMKIIELAK